MNRMILPLLAVCPALLSSCSTQFNRLWRDAAKTTPPAQTIEGCWEGKWNSVGTGHTGKLRCVVGPATNSEGDHAFTYHATWGHFLSGSFASTHRVRQSASSFAFQGTHKMPEWAGGTYDYHGTVKNGRFEATYHCAKDHGSFEMTRPGGR